MPGSARRMCRSAGIWSLINKLGAQVIEVGEVTRSALEVIQCHSDASSNRSQEFVLSIKEVNAISTGLSISCRENNAECRAPSIGWRDCKGAAEVEKYQLRGKVVGWIVRSCLVALPSFG